MPIKLKAIPKTLGGLSDSLYYYREELRELARLNKVAEDRIKAHIKKIEDTIINNFDKTRIEGAKGKNSQIFINKEDVPTVRAEDWEKVWSWVLAPRSNAKKLERFSILQHRLSSTACREYWEDGEKIDGVRKYKKVTIGCRKV